MRFFSHVSTIFPAPKKLGALCVCGAALLCLSNPPLAHASGIAGGDRVSLARNFVEKMKSGFSRAEKFLSLGVSENGEEQSLNSLPEGEPLLFQVQLGEENLTIVGGVLTEYKDGALLASFRDFISTLGFPIEVADDGSAAEGWYIKEGQKFFLDVNAGVVQSDLGSFDLSSDVDIRNGDIYVPLDEIGSWFNITSKVNTASLNLTIESVQKLPLQERLSRQSREIVRNQKPPVRFEQVAKEYEVFTPPYVDVSTTNRFSRNSERGQRDASTSYNIRTSGDFLRGTLKTNLNGGSDGGLNAARFNYSKTALEPELLGALKAREYEIGDVVSTRLPLTGGAGLEVGARVTNRDPLLSSIFPTTQITGDIRPGWDVELYREGSLVSFQTADVNGFYNFEDVRLFRGENSFKLIFYGLQGEVQEKNLEVPVNSDQLNRSGVYDVSVTAAESKILDLSDDLNISNPDENDPHIVARYEMPVGDQSAVGIGFRSRPEDGVRNNYLQGSVSTVLGPSLLNLDVAVNDEADGAAEVTLRRGFGEGHEMNSSLFVATDNYTPNATSDDNIVVRNRYNLTGPFKALGDKSRYSVFSNYTRATGDVSSLSVGASATARVGKTSLSQSVRYQNDQQADNSTDRLTTSTLVSRYVGGNNLRFITDYQVVPETELETLRASVNRVISSDLDGVFEVRRDVEEEFTTGTLGVNWRTDYARISPQVSYDTDGTFSALLSTTMGITPDRDGGIEFAGRNVTGLGGVSAFVFVDANGNGAFDEGEFPIENAEINAVQGSRRAISDDSGRAFIQNLRENTLTDIVLEPESLQDPFWIPAQDNVSVRPRPGYVAKLNFPVLNAGELDGFVYASLPDGTQRPLRGVRLNLYEETGDVAQTAISGGDGFYLFSLIRPGSYYLVAQGDTLPNSVLPAKPQRVDIGYDGTIIYGNEIYLGTTGDTDGGSGVMSVDILRDLDGYLAQNKYAGVELDAADEVILNLGSYKSRLMMALKWYVVKSRYANILRGMDALVPPADSYASTESGEHILRAVISGQSFDDAYKRCTALSARGLSCAVEVLPGALSGATEKTAMLSEDKI